MHKLIPIMLVTVLTACSQDPIERCVAAQMDQFDAEAAQPKPIEAAKPEELTSSSAPPVDGMARFRLEGPDGVIHFLDAPKDSSEEQILALAEVQFGTASNPVDVEPETRTEFKARANLICLAASRR